MIWKVQPCLSHFLCGNIPRSVCHSQQPHRAPPSSFSSSLLSSNYHLAERNAVDIIVSKSGFTFPYSEFSGSAHLLCMHALDTKLILRFRTPLHQYADITVSLANNYGASSDILLGRCRLTRARSTPFRQRSARWPLSTQPLSLVESPLDSVRACSETAYWGSKGAGYGY